MEGLSVGLSNVVQHISFPEILNAKTIEHSFSPANVLHNRAEQIYTLPAHSSEKSASVSALPRTEVL